MQLIFNAINRTVLFLFISLGVQAYAQQPAYFLFAQDQFEGIDIYNIIQDKASNYWFATDQGIYIHDGYTFKKIDAPEMKSNAVFNFVINSKGTIYCSNLNQQVFQIKHEKCELIFNIPDKGTDINLAISTSDELYISTSKGIYVLNEKNQLVLSNESKENETFATPFLTKSGYIIQHNINNSWVSKYKNGQLKKYRLDNFHPAAGSDEFINFFSFNTHIYAINRRDMKAYTFDETNNQLLPYDFDTKELKNHLFRYYTTSNTLWLANNIAGVTAYDSQLKPLFNNKLLFEDYFISHVYQDHEGNVLLATFDQGIIVIPNINQLDVDPLFNDKFITRIVNGDQDGIFFGTRQGSIYRYESNKLYPISERSNKRIETLFYWKNQQKLFEDTKGGTLYDLKKNTHKNLNFGALKDVVSIDSETILLGLNAEVLLVEIDPSTNQIRRKTPVIQERAYAVAFENESKQIYCSTGSGLYSFRINDKIKEITHNGSSITALDFSNYKDGVYVASTRQGIFYCKKGKVVEQYLPTYNDEQLNFFKIKIHNDKMYANTQFGLLTLDLQGNILHHLNKSTGLSTNKIIDFEICNDELWVVHSRGVQRFKLSDLSCPIIKPLVQLKSIAVNHKKIKSGQNHFAYTDRNFNFELKVPTLKNRENIKYWFKLEGVNETWVINTYTNNKIQYNYLSPGSYTLLVKAENNGVFSDPIRYTFNITTPFFLQWWFWALMVLLCLVVIVLFYRRKLKIQQNKADRRNELNASKLTAIQSQMNPHFIFNSLNSIQDLVLKGDVDNSYTFITKFSNLVRRTLNYSDKDFIDFEQEIKLIELYLSLEKLRFKEDVSFELITNGIEDIQIPPMLIQPFIENALVHGLLHKEGPKKLQLRFTLKDVLYCEIIDNGIGREKANAIKLRQRAEHESFAIQAINKRFVILKEHFNNAVGFEYEDIMESGEVAGTKVILKIPIKHKY